MSEGDDASSGHVLQRGALRVRIAGSTDALDPRFGPRFDRTAYVAELTCHGHAFLAAPGLCDEFGLTGMGVLGFEEAQPGETFLKIGVGRLRRESAATYDFRHRYQQAETFPIELTTTDQSLTVRQATPAGERWGYTYIKTYALLTANAMNLRYSLTNTGAQAYSFEHYNHHWFAFQHKEIGPDYRLRMSWPVAASGTPAWTLSAAGLSPTPAALPSPGIRSAFAAPNQPAELALEHTRLGQVVVLRTDFVPARFAVWANPEAFCPEIFYRMTLLPGMSADWSVRYMFSLGPPTETFAR